MYRRPEATPQQVRMIRTLGQYRRYHPQRIARDLNIPIGMVRRVLRGEVRPDIQGQKLPHLVIGGLQTHLNQLDCLEIERLYSEGRSKRLLAKKFKVRPSTIQTILRPNSKSAKTAERKRLEATQ